MWLQMLVGILSFVFLLLLGGCFFWMSVFNVKRLGLRKILLFVLNLKPKSQTRLSVGMEVDFDSPGSGDYVGVIQVGIMERKMETSIQGLGRKLPATMKAQTKQNLTCLGYSSPRPKTLCRKPPSVYHKGSHIPPMQGTRTVSGFTSLTTLTKLCQV